MRRLALAAALACVAVCAGTARAASAPALSVRPSFSPSVHLFADAVTARVDVAVDPSRVDPGSVTVTPHFAPYVWAREGVERLSGGPRLVLLRFGFRLRCTTAACVPRAAQKSFAFRPAVVRFRPLGGRVQTMRAVWPPLTVASRLTPNDRAMPVLRETVAPPAAVTRVPAGPLGVALLSGGGALLLAGLAGLVLVFRPRRRAVATPPLQRALRRVEQAAAGAVDDRRRALHALALELERERLEARAREARKLAWASGAPVPEAMQSLVGDVRTTLREAAA